MIRFLNTFAFVALIVSAGFAYSVKYEALAHHEEVLRLQTSIKDQRNKNNALKAEWALLNRPDRLQDMANKHLTLQQLDVRQLARFSDLVERSENRNNLAKQLERLGLGGTITTPSDVATTSQASHASQVLNGD